MHSVLGGLHKSKIRDRRDALQLIIPRMCTMLPRIPVVVTVAVVGAAVVELPPTISVSKQETNISSVYLHTLRLPLASVQLHRIKSLRKMVCSVLLLRRLLPKEPTTIGWTQGQKACLLAGQLFAEKSGLGMKHAHKAHLSPREINSLLCDPGQISSGHPLDFVSVFMKASTICQSERGQFDQPLQSKSVSCFFILAWRSMKDPGGMSNAKSRVRCIPI